MIVEEVGRKFLLGTQSSTIQFGLTRLDCVLKQGLYNSLGFLFQTINSFNAISQCKITPARTHSIKWTKILTLEITIIDGVF